METLIKQLEKRPVSIERLSTVVPSHTKCILYEDLKAPLFPDGVRCLIILMESKTEEIGHFVLVINRPGGVEYWSSYGHRPEYAIKITGNDRRLLDLMGKKYSVNRYKFQAEEDTETCAMHTLSRAVFWEMENKKYWNLFRFAVHLRSPDDVVSLMTLLHRELMGEI